MSQRTDRLCNLRVGFTNVAQVVLPASTMFDDRAIEHEGHIYANGRIDGNLVSYTYDRLTIVRPRPVTAEDVAEFERGIAERKAYEKQLSQQRCEPEEPIDGPW
jgi:hypothetical protein